jgi:hypothetical protein
VASYKEISISRVVLMKKETDVSVFIDRNGRFGAFWRDESDALILFAPHKSGRVFNADLGRWGSYRANLTKPGDDELYSDDLLCASYDFSLANIYVNKDTVQKLSIPLSSYYPRVWRGIASNYPLDGGYSSRSLTVTEHASRLQSTIAATSLFQELVQLFRYIEPEPANASSFGHRVRELLILAATEVEANWRGVIVANSSSPQPGKVFTTRDYVKLLPLLKLDQWGVVLKDYASYQTIWPFDNWSASKPTKSLAWYNAYNEVKHDREGNFDKACLGHLIEAMAAIHVLQAAQWGPDIYSEIFQGDFSPFRITYRPEVVISELYICPPGDINHPMFYFDGQ